MVACRRTDPFSDIKLPADEAPHGCQGHFVANGVTVRSAAFVVPRCWLDSLGLGVLRFSKCDNFFATHARQETYANLAPALCDTAVHILQGVANLNTSCNAANAPSKRMRVN
eukprot:3403126-Amphidinium_carterae.1